MFDKRKSNNVPESSSETRPAEPTMAGSSGQSQHAGKAAIIGAGIRINGDISGSENIQVEGKVDGRINLGSNDVTIGKSGQVTADVVAKTIRVSGEVNGDLTAKERVVISGTGNVRGNVVAPRVVLEDGAIFKGSIDMDPGDSAVSGLAGVKAQATAKANGSKVTESASAAAPAKAASAEAAGKPSELSLKGG